MQSCNDPGKSHLVRSYDSLAAHGLEELKEHIKACPGCKQRLGLFTAIDRVLESEKDRLVRGHPTAMELFAFCGLDDQTLSKRTFHEIEVHLQGCAQCREGVGLLETFKKEQTLSNPEEGDLDPAQVRARAARLKFLVSEEGEERPRFSALRRRMIVALTSAAALILLFLGTRLAHKEASDSWFRSVEAKVTDRQRNGGGGNRIKEKIVLHCVLNRSAWLYAFVEGSNGRLMLLYPRHSGERPVEAAAGISVSLPRNGHELSISGEAGTEELFMLAALEKPVDEKMLIQMSNRLTELWDRSLRDLCRFQKLLNSQTDMPVIRIELLRYPLDG